MTDLFTFYTKVILFYPYRGNKRIKDVLIPYEASHHNNHKTYKSIQFKPILPHLHQLVFLNKTPEEVINMINGLDDHIKLSFTLEDIKHLSKKIVFSDVVHSKEEKLFMVKMYKPFNPSDFLTYKLFKKNHNFEAAHALLTKNLIKHLQRVSDLCGLDQKIELTIIPETITENVDDFSYFDFIFKTSDTILHDLNIGRNIAWGNGSIYTF